MNGSAEKLSLDAFCAALDAEPAARARVAAARIDELARIGAACQGIERRFWPWWVLGGVLFVAGSVILALPYGWFVAVRDLIGFTGIAVMLCVLPGSLLVYFYAVRERTRADRETTELNSSHFLPHGGLYFAAEDTRPAAIVRVDWTPPAAPADTSIWDGPPRDPRKNRNARASGLW